MSTKENDIYLESLRETLIEENENKLQEVHAKGYMGTDDDMPDAFESWLENLTIEELQAYTK